MTKLLTVSWKTTTLCARIILYVPMFIIGVLLEMLSLKGGMGEVGGRSDYNIGTPEPTIRPESYRKMKRRNRLMRKYGHRQTKNHPQDEKN